MVPPSKQRIPEGWRMAQHWTRCEEGSHVLNSHLADISGSTHFLHGTTLDKDRGGVWIVTSHFIATYFFPLPPTVFAWDKSGQGCTGVDAHVHAHMQEHAQTGEDTHIHTRAGERERERESVCVCVCVCVCESERERERERGREREQQADFQFVQFVGVAGVGNATPGNTPDTGAGSHVHILQPHHAKRGRDFLPTSQGGWSCRYCPPPTSFCL
jgi:hypothetical protein